MCFIPFIPVVISAIVYFTILFGIFYLIYKWVTKFISLKQEHNDLLREIIKKMESK
jgi:hypothetical protein